MSPWTHFPPDYRAAEVQEILSATRAGECVAVIGLSGAGKSNLLGYIEQRFSLPEAETGVNFTLVDCNRLTEKTPSALFQLIRRRFFDSDTAKDEFEGLNRLLKERIAEGSGSQCILLDRFDVLTMPENQVIYDHLRVLRDLHKYKLTYVVATRRPLSPNSELAELFFAHTIWLGPLAERDAHWNIAQYAQRLQLEWDEEDFKTIYQTSWGYPSLLRGICEAYAGGSGLDEGQLLAHPAVRRRVEEFWFDKPSDTHLQASGLSGQPLLMASQPLQYDSSSLTDKEHRLLDYLRDHPGQVCEKDDLIRAVWPEDRVYERGVRDDSLAQMVRRLRVKIEPDPSNPRFIRTVPGRGYLFKPI